MSAKISTTRQVNLQWDTHIMVNEHDRMQSYSMTIPARPQEDGTSLDWIMRYGKPEQDHIFSALSIMESYEYLLSADITAAEAIQRLRCLRREYQSQPAPKPSRGEAA